MSIFSHWAIISIVFSILKRWKGSLLIHLHIICDICDHVLNSFFAPLHNWTKNLLRDKLFPCYVKISLNWRIWKYRLTVSRWFCAIFWPIKIIFNSFGFLDLEYRGGLDELAFFIVIRATWSCTPQVSKD